MRHLLFISLLIAFLSYGAVFPKALPAAENYTEGEVTDGGAIVGIVKYEGDLTTPSLNLPGEWELSESPKTGSEKVVVNKINHGLKYAVVSIADISQGKRRKIPVIHPIIDQQKNTFIPRVTALLAGTTVDILNGDEELHTIHTRSVKNQPFNFGTSYKQRVSIKFDNPEVVKLTCDIHKKTYAWIIILDNPYFDITDKHGYFEMSDIPPGRYKVKVWHEEFGNLEKEVEVKLKETINIEFVYSQY